MCTRSCVFATHSTCTCECGHANHGSGTTIDSYLGYQSEGPVINISERIVSKQSIVVYNSPSLEALRVYHSNLPRSHSVNVDIQTLPMNILRDAGIYTVSALCPPIGTAIALYGAAKFAYTVYNDVKENDDKKLVGDVLRHVVSTSVENMGFSTVTQFMAPIIQTQQSTSSMDSQLPSEILTASSKSLLVSSAVNLTDLAVKTALTYG